MKKHYALLFPLIWISLFFPVSLTAQQIDLEWMHLIGSSHAEHPGRVVTDGCGNVYATGWFHDPVDLDPGPGVHMAVSNGDFDVYLIKFNPNGTFEWALTFGGNGFEDVLGLTVEQGNSESCGAVFLAGSFNQSVDFDPSPSTAIKSSNGLSDAYVLKIDESGNFDWVQTFGGQYSDFSRYLSMDKFGNLLVAGAFQGTADFNPGTGTDWRTSSGNDDGFLVKLQPDGQLDWVNTVGGSEFDRYTASAADPQGNVYAIGSFQDVVDLDPGNAILSTSSAGQRDFFLQKFNPAGQLLWAFGIGGDNGEDAHDLVVDNQGNVTLAGTYGIKVDFDPGPGTEWHSIRGDRNVFVVQYDPLGNFNWIYIAGDGQYDQARSITQDEHGNFFVTGTFSTNVDFDPGPNVASMNGIAQDVFFVCLSPAGKFQWARQITGPEMQFARSLHYHDGYLYFSGSTHYAAEARFDNGWITRNPVGAYDYLVAKIKLTSVVSVQESNSITDLDVFPNPTSGLIQIDVVPGLFQTVTLFNLQGQALVPATSLQTQMDISHLPKGVYLLRLDGTGDSTVKRVVKY